MGLKGTSFLCILGRQYNEGIFSEVG